jgi:hypothetical protein
MKKLVTSVALVLVATLGWAQSARTEFEVIREEFKAEKKAVVAGFMNLSDADAMKFWPVYDKYEAERTKIGTERFNLINRYVEQFNSLNDEQSDELLKKSLSIQKQELDLKNKYYKEVKKSIGASKAMAFIQLEDYISVVIRGFLYESLPLIEVK